MNTPLIVLCALVALGLIVAVLDALLLSVAPVEGDGVLCVFGREDVFGARGSGWWAASG